MRPNGELPSDHYADRRGHTPGVGRQAHLAVQRPAAFSGVKALRNTSDAKVASRQALLAFRSLDPLRALRGPDRRRRDEEPPFPLRTKNRQQTKNNHLTGKAPYKSANFRFLSRVRASSRQCAMYWSSPGSGEVLRPAPARRACCGLNGARIGFAQQGSSATPRTAGSYRTRMAAARSSWCCAAYFRTSMATILRALMSATHLPAATRQAPVCLANRRRRAPVPHLQPSPCRVRASAVRSPHGGFR